MLRKLFGRKAQKPAASDPQRLEDIRFETEVIPFEGGISGHIDACEDELKPKVLKDYHQIREQFLLPVTPAPADEQKLYFATAGAPAGGKSTEMEYMLEAAEDARYLNIVKTDPDVYALEYMNHTYRPLMGRYQNAALGPQEMRARAYNRARAGSNIIASSLLNEAVSTGRHVAHGTTMTGGHSASLLEAIGAQGYERRLLINFAADQIRKDGVERRSNKEGNYQVSADDFEEKGKKFFERVPDYFGHGDHLILKYKVAADQRPILAAEYKNGTRIIHDKDVFFDLVLQYEGWRAKNNMKRYMSLDIQSDDDDLGGFIPSFAELEQRYYARAENGLVNGYTPLMPEHAPVKSKRFGLF